MGATGKMHPHRSYTTVQEYINSVVCPGERGVPAVCGLLRPERELAKLA